MFWNTSYSMADADSDTDADGHAIPSGINYLIYS